MRRSRNSCEFLLKRRFVHTAGSSSRNCFNKTIPNQKPWTRNYIRSRIYVKFQYYYVRRTDWLKHFKNNYDLEQMFSNQTMVQGHLVQAMSNQAGSGFSDLQSAQSPQWSRSLDGGHTRWRPENQEKSGGGSGRGEEGHIWKESPVTSGAIVGLRD